MAVINGTAGNDSLTGTDSTDSISGLQGNDTLNGLGAIDTLNGGAGDDTYIVTAGDVLQDSGGIDTVRSGISWTLGAGFENITLTGTSAISATGNELDNFAIGNSAANSFNLRAGNDTVQAGAGDDRINLSGFGSPSYGDDVVDGGTGFDALIFQSTTEQSGVVVDLAAGTAFGGGQGGAGSVQFTSIERVIGTNGFGDRLSGSAVSERLEGRGGNDTLNGRFGDDTLDGGDGDDDLNGDDGFGQDVTVGKDLLRGGAGNDTLRNDMNDFSGTAHFDTLDGGLGNDTYDLRAFPFGPQAGSVIVDAGGIDRLLSNHDVVLPDGIENLELFEGTTGTGNALDNLIRTNGNEPHFYGVDGADGDDTVLGGADEDHVSFRAGSGNYGNDSVDGGDGFDTISFDGVRSAVVVDMRGGTATGGGIGGSGSVRFTNVETVVGSAFDDRLTAHDGVTVFSFGSQFFVGGHLLGGGGNDTLTAGAGIDTLEGGAGADRFLFAQAPGDASADLVRGFTSGGDEIALDAAAHANVGAAGDFAPGDARFASGAGLTSGRDASDRVIYDTTTGNLFYDADGNGAGAAQRIATLEGAPPLAATDITVVGNGAPPTGGQTITGTAGNDSLTGTNGNDTLDGLGGVDTMNGLLGDDTYVVTAGDVLQDSGGIDTVRSGVTWTLGAGFENITLAGTAAINATGNELANLASGNAAANSFNLRAGNDTVQAGAGDDRINLSGFGSPSYGDDVVDAGAGFDALIFHAPGEQSGVVVDLAAGTALGGGQGGAGSVRFTSIERVIGTDGFADRLSGSAVSERLEGRGGNDTLSGLGGNDTLAGELGNDMFVFAAAPGAGNVDLVTDFVSAGDKVAFENAVFTALGGAGNFAAGDARFAAGAGFTSGRDGSDRIVYNTTTGALYYDADGSGAGAAVQVATLQGAPAVAAADITVI